MDSVRVRRFAVECSDRAQSHVVGLYSGRVQQIALANQSHHLLKSDAQRFVNPSQISQHVFPFSVVAKQTKNNVFIIMLIAAGVGRRRDVET